MPTLLITPEDDKLVGPEAAADMVAGIASCRRTPGRPDDRRRVTLTLTNAGRSAAAQVAAAEAQLHALIDATIPSRQLASTINVLRRIVAGRPGGDALELRRAAHAKSRR